jgi:hypothetical protein
LLGTFHLSAELENLFDLRLLDLDKLRLTYSQVSLPTSVALLNSSVTPRISVPASSQREEYAMTYTTPTWKHTR